MTIRARVTNGLLQPLEPLPPEWTEGDELNLTGKHVTVGEERRIDAAFAKLEKFAAKLDDLEDWRLIEQSLAEQKRLGKGLMRRKMGL